MIPSNPVPQVCNYGTSATYRDLPNEEQLRNGVVPLDSLPAAWWNCMWNMTNGAINCARYAAGVLIDEVNTVLAQAGVRVNCSCVDQLYQAINKIRQTIGTAAVAGAVKSSSTASEVAIDPTTGIMSVNCLGNAASLTTTASTVVGAINELKSTYDTCWSNNATALNGKAPTNHASSANTYGVGSATNYGHLKISDTYTSVLATCSGVAASQKAVACIYAVAAAAAADNISLGNTAGCALGTASAGTATTAARSDHVHPVQNYIPYTGAGNGVVTAYQASTAYCGSAAEWASYLIFNHGDGSSYCNQMIRMPFVGVPQYQRKSNGINSGWKTFITSENIASQSVNYATSAGSAGSATNANKGKNGSSYSAFGSNAFNSNSYLLTTGCAADSAKLGGTAANCYALKEGNVATADGAGSICYAFVKGKWVCTCSPGQGICCVRLYVCSATAGQKLVFPGNCFMYVPRNSQSYVAVAAQCVNITAADINKWVVAGPTYTVSCLDCISPRCTTTQNMVALSIY